jgi:hypothetical protein
MLFPDAILRTSISATLPVPSSTSRRWSRFHTAVNQAARLLLYFKRISLCIELLTDSSPPATTEFTIFSAAIQKYVVRQFNSRNGCSVSLGCWVRQTHKPKHFWKCSNLRLHELQTKWAVRSQAAEEAILVRGMLLAGKWVTRIWEQRINVKFCVKETPWSESGSELYRPSDRRLSAKWLPTFADRGCNVASVTDPSGRILGFLDRSHYFSIK